jgi:hypothetical protein
MYGNNIGSVSGIVHVFARRPVLAATLVLAAVAVANVPTTPPPPPTPPTPAVVTYTAPAPEVSAVADPQPATVPTFDATCQFGPKAVVTNLCKASLDSVALFLQNYPNQSVVVRGSLNNVIGVRHYLTSGESKFGIAASRVTINADDTLGNQVSIREQ